MAAPNIRSTSALSPKVYSMRIPNRNSKVPRASKLVVIILRAFLNGSARQAKYYLDDPHVSAMRFTLFTSQTGTTSALEAAPYVVASTVFVEGLPVI